MAEKTFFFLIKQGSSPSLSLLEKLKTEDALKQENVYLTSEKWIPNLISILTSTYPTHHRMWTQTSEPGLHIDNVVSNLNDNNSKCVLIGHDESIKVSRSIGIEPEHTSVAVNNEELFGHVKDAVNRDGEKEREFLFYIIDDWCGQLTETINSIVEREDDAPLTRLFITAIDSIGRKQNEMKKPVFWFSNEENTEIPFDAANELISILDLAPTILLHNGVPRPNNMLGKEISWLFNDEARKKESRTRKNILLEFENGEKSLITENFRFNAKLGMSKGEIYDLKKDPEENNNLWDNLDTNKIKRLLYLEFLTEQMHKEVTPMPRIAGA